MLCATTRRAPAARAAATRVPETSRRRRPVASKPRFTATGLADWARLVNWLTTTSGSALRTARARVVATQASPTAATTVGRPRAVTLASDRENTVTSWPAPTSAATR